MGVRFRVDERGIDDLLESAPARRLVSEAARQVAGGAAELAPDGGPHRGVRETYRSTPAVASADGVKASAFTTDIAGHLVEFGSIKNTAYAPLRRAVVRAGLVLKLIPKGG